MAPPTPQATGPVVSGVGAITVPWPTHEADDVALLFVETANEAVSLSTPAGFVAVTNSPQGTGTAGGETATRLSVFWCRATSAAMSSPVVADSGNHQLAVICTYRGCIASGNPWDVTAGDVAAAASSTATIPGGTTTVDETLVVVAVTNPEDPDAELVGNFANASLVNLAERVNTQSAVPASANRLRVGLMVGTSSLIGKGPGAAAEDTTGNKYSAMVAILATTEIQAAIAAADVDDVLLLLNFGGGRSRWMDQNGNFSFALYEQSVRRYQAVSAGGSWTDETAAAVLKDAIARKRVIPYVLDEANHSFFKGQFTPTLVNQACALHKSIWPGCVTTVRMTPTTLSTGWDNNQPPAGGYTALDYAWVQSAGQHWRSGLTPSTHLAQEKAIADTLDIGIGCSLNLWAGGIADDTDGVTACWDYLDTGASNGGVVGTPALSGFNEGNILTCSALGTYAGNVIANPAWIQHYFDVVSQLSYLPWALMWGYPDGLVDWANTYFHRSDSQGARDYAITQGLARSSWDGWRTIK